MILLEFHNRIVAETISSRLEGLEDPNNVNGDIKAVDITVADFDGVMFHMSNPVPTETNKVLVSIKMSFFHELEDHNVQEVLAREYGSLATEAEPGYNYSVIIDLKALPCAAGELIRKVALLKRNCFAGVFEKFFRLQKTWTPESKPQQAVVHYRPKETMYVSCQKDRVTVVFSTLFSDKDDVIIGGIFLQEFKEGRKGNSQAPQVLYSKDVPQELTDTQALTGDNVGYITFVLFPRHIEDKSQNNTIDLIHTFRDYLHYHIKCSKAYLFSRMRARTSELLKILNRARPDEPVEKNKTKSGKTFTRSDTAPPVAPRP